MDRGKGTAFPRFRRGSQVARRGRWALARQPSSGRPAIHTSSAVGGRRVDYGEIRIVLQADVFEIANIREDAVRPVDLGGGMEGGGLGGLGPGQLGRGIGCRADGGHDLM